MRSAVVCSMTVLFVAFAPVALAADVPALQKISDHVYAYVDAKGATPSSSFGANAGVIVGRDAALVVDTLISAKKAELFLADIRKITDKPVRYVVNTHYHLDHAWGNAPFAAAGAVIIGHDTTVRDLLSTAERLAQPEASGLSAAEMAGTTLVPPTVCFSERLTVDLGGLTVELRYPGPTHTAGSITAYVPQDKVLFTGDILFTRYHPNLGEADLANWLKVLDELAKVDAVKIVPGHGPLSTKTDMAELKTYIQDFDLQARALCAGKGQADAAALAKQLLKSLPEQQRTELLGLVERNLRARYLAPPGDKK